jgi:high-affinity iron transporter
MLGSLLITLREGLEAALIIGIILAYLASVGRRDQFRSVWLGTGLAIAVTLVAGGVIVWVFGGLSDQAKQIFEGMSGLLAVAVLSYMVIWMRRQARNIKVHLEAQVDGAVQAGSMLAMVSLAFIIVVREGVETVLFLFSFSRAGTTPAALLSGGLVGLGIAIAIAYAGYKGSRRINLSTFFNVTGVLLIFLAAGLLAYGVHELQEAGVFPVIQENVWNINHLLNEKAGVGSFLKTLFGYNGNPELLEIVLYLSYLTTTFWYFSRPIKVKKEMKAAAETR